MASNVSSSVSRRKPAIDKPVQEPMTSKTRISTRRHDLDNLRAFLTGLVIWHHTSNAYGGPGSGPYKSPLIATALTASRLPLFIFNALNHSFFMGLFLWISGRNSAQSLERIDADEQRTRWSFVWNKILRLGLPAVFFTLVLEPAALLVGQPSAEVAEFLAKYYSELDGIRGVVWYTANLLIFDLVATMFFSTGSKDSAGHSKLYVLARKYGWVVTTVAAFLIRLKYPVGTTIKPIALQVAFAPQYVYAYAMGFASANEEPYLTGPFTGSSDVDVKGDKKSPGRHMSPSLAVLLSILLVPLPQIPQLFGKFNKDLGALGSTGIFGGWNLASFLYAMWNELSFTLIGPAVAAAFYRSYNKPMPSLRPKDAYGAFMVHMLVSTIVEKGVDSVLIGYHPAFVQLLDYTVWKSCGLILMTALVGAINIVASFVVARFVLGMLPALRRII